jgi:biofilm PGA synthesis N-glycosyltransferase PgaC
VTFLFWFSAAFVLYTYFGYPLLVLLWPRKRGWKRAPFRPRVSFVVAVRNEESRIEAKVQHLLSLPYPRELCEIVVISDGSNDRTPEILECLASRGDIRAITYPEHRGKAHALNLGVAAASGEIVVFNDARQKLAPDALPTLLENFADPAVGCVTGELHFVTDGAPSLQSTLYWKFERWLRRHESRLGACMGATGAFYGIRRSLFRPLPEGLLLDDVFTPLHIALRGQLVIHDSRAIVWDSEAASEIYEFRRKVRTLTGNYQLLVFLPRLLLPNRLGFQFFSHKTTRLLAPLFLALCLISSALLPGAFYRAAALAQAVFYGVAALGAISPRLPGPLRIPHAFVVLNAAAVAALLNFLRGKTNVWTR